MESSLNYSTKNARVKAGKVIEAKIIEAMKSIGFNVKNATSKQDMIDKIDGFLLNSFDYEYLNTAKAKSALQIKYRLPENKRLDIVFETTWLHDFNGNERRIESQSDFDGRDFIGKSDIYVVLSMNGKTIHICNTKDIKSRAAELTMRLLQSGKRSLNNEYGEARIVSDYGDSAESGIVYKKVIFYAIPSTNSIHDIQLSQSIF